jgi:O-antigen chain-terminating methyltransferase
MLETRSSDLDVERIMYEIRDAVAEQHNGVRTNGSVASSSWSANRVTENGDALHLQPPFQPRLDNHYHVNDLLRFHGFDFIRNSYLALLAREPDETGVAQHIEALASGHFNKLDVLASLHSSPEGRSNNVRLNGLSLPIAVRRLGRVPVLGYLIRLLIGVARLPRLVQHQNQFEFYLWSQLQRIVDHQNQSKREATEALAQMSAQILEGMQRTADQQHARLDDLRTNLNQSVSKLAEQLALHEAEFSRMAAEKEENRFDDLYASFEDRFRGERQEVQQRLEVYLPVLKEAHVTKGVLDLGSGRGEWLQLLRNNGIGCQGVDRNRVFVEDCRRAGLEVFEADALAHLRNLPPESLNAVTSFHLVEHLPFEVLIKLLDEIARTLKPGGLVILETPNPENFMVGSCSFYTDPTHRNPIPSQTLQFLLESRGFGDINVLKLRPWDAAKLEGDSELIKRFNEYFYSAPDYGIIAKKPATAS